MWEGETVNDLHGHYENSATIIALTRMNIIDSE